MLIKRIDRIVESTKWPAAFFATAALPCIAVAIWLLGTRAIEFPLYSSLFLFGVVLFLAMCRTRIVKLRIVASAVTLERDLTQAVLAFLMLHPVVGHGGNAAKGSRLKWLGKGNWLMLSAPYFIPTGAILMWFVSWLLPIAALRCVVLGFGTSYHIAAVTYHCYSGTSELRRLGVRFCWMFLLAANMLVVASLTSFALDGFSGISTFLTDCLQLPRWILEIIQSPFQSRSTESIDSSIEPVTNLE